LPPLPGWVDYPLETLKRISCLKDGLKVLPRSSCDTFAYSLVSGWNHLVTVGVRVDGCACACGWVWVCFLLSQGGVGVGVGVGEETDLTGE
jgi:hypothetical protein